MENASEALMMAFGVLILVIALTVSMVSFNRVKNVSDIVLYTADETNYYDYTGAKGKVAENRIVGLETIIPTLYHYYDENYTVFFRKADYDENGNFSKIDPLIIYSTNTNRSNWSSKYMEFMYNKYGNVELLSGLNTYDIFSFDIEEEDLRHEPWGTKEQAMDNLECLINGGIYYNPNGDGTFYDYGDGLISRFQGEKFVETIGEYTYNLDESTGNTEDDTTADDTPAVTQKEKKEKKKRIIIFTQINE